MCRERARMRRYYHSAYTANFRPVIFLQIKKCNFIQKKIRKFEATKSMPPTEQFRYTTLQGSRRRSSPCDTAASLCQEKPTPGWWIHIQILPKGLTTKADKQLKPAEIQDNSDNKPRQERSGRPTESAMENRLDRFHARRDPGGEEAGHRTDNRRDHQPDQNVSDGQHQRKVGRRVDNQYAQQNQ